MKVNIYTDFSTRQEKDTSACRRYLLSDVLNKAYFVIRPGLYIATFTSPSTPYAATPSTRPPGTLSSLASSSLQLDSPQLRNQEKGNQNQKLQIFYLVSFPWRRCWFESKLF